MKEHLKRGASGVHLGFRLSCAVLALAACFQTFFDLPAARSVSGQEPPSPAVLSQKTRLVVVPVSVTDRQGHFVSGLKEPDFRVYEDGKLQQIAVFRDADVPVTVGILVDRSGSMAAKSDEVIQGATALVDASNPQDNEFVVNFGDTATFGLPANVPFTSNVAELRAALSTPSASG